MVLRVEYKRPWLYPKQQAAIFADARYVLIEASTKSGKTVGALVWIAERAMQGRAGQHYWWVAPVYGQTKIAFRRLKRFLPHWTYSSNESELTVSLRNGAIIDFRSAEKPDALYGEDVYAAVIDEATRCREESWHAVRSTLTATRGGALIIGNVKGRKNWAYKLARRAEAGDSDMAYARLTAYDAVAGGVLTKDEVEDAKRMLPDNVFRELYLAEPSDDGGNPFGLEAIEACIVEDYSTAAPVVWGWDLAKSMDWTVGVALDEQGDVTACERWQGPWETTITRIQTLTGETAALVDSTGVGDPVLESLQAAGGRNYEGFKFSAPSKQQLMEGLAVAIQQGQVSYPDGVLRNELDAFEYSYTRTGVHYSAPEGMHDDCVCALALAVRAKSGARPEGDYGLTI